MRWLRDAARWWRGSRLPEPEAMDDPSEVEAYAGAAAEHYLARLDEGAARRTARLAGGARQALDVGCGPARIPLSVAARLPELLMVGVDLSMPMLRRAKQEASRLGLQSRVRFVRASATALPFRDATFGLVASNSLLHHLARPENALEEVGRVASPRAALFLRDLRRPPRPCLRAHSALFGRHYEGRMRQLFEASVRASYTHSELRRLVKPLAGARVRRRGWTHLEVRRRASE